MKCVICKLGETSIGVTTVTLTQVESTVVVKMYPLKSARIAESVIFPARSALRL